jgi:hypothetical protein
MQVADSVAVAVVVVASSLSPSAVEASSSLEASVAAADLEVVAFLPLLPLPLPTCDLTVPLNSLAVDSSAAAFAAEAVVVVVVELLSSVVGSSVADSFDHASVLCSLLLAELLLITVPATVAVAADLDLLLQVAVDLAVLVPASYVEVAAAWAYLASFDEVEVAFLDDGDGVDVLVVVAWAYLLLLVVVLASYVVVGVSYLDEEGEAFASLEVLVVVLLLLHQEASYVEGGGVDVLVVMAWAYLV